MLSLFGKKKKENNGIYAPVDGDCMDISQVKDETFASRAMGDGVGIRPSSQTVVSPCDGTITAMFETGHAFGITADCGVELLVHIGIDTVELQGKGFHVLKKKGMHVKKGDPIVRIDLEEIEKEYDSTVMVVAVGEVPAEKTGTLPRRVEAGDLIMTRRQ